MDENSIETRIDYSNGDVFIIVESGKFDQEWNGHGYLFERTDFHEDGSASKYYGIELEEKHYKAILYMLENRIE